MGYHEAMDIRGIAWAGYFFDPGALIPVSTPVFIRPPEVSGDEVITDITAGTLRPKLDGDDTTTVPPQIYAEELDPGLDPESLKPRMKADE
jgi:hypothetical protein